MTITLDDLGGHADTIRRDRWGRYLVVPPDGGKPRPYTRATTVAKAIEDQHSLIDWKARVTAKGLAVRGELLKMIAVTDDRDELNRLVEQAAQAGGATERRDEGTALHRALELAMTGQPVPALFAADVDAVHAELARHGLAVVDGFTERMCVDDDRAIAGMFDLIVTDGQRQFVADFKTGRTLDYSGLAFAVQLAIYAGATHLYTQGATADADRREPMPNVDRDVALIMHVQPNSGHCTIHDVDIARGARWLDLCLAVRDARSETRSKTGNPITSRTATAPPPAPPVEGASRRDKILERLRTLKELDARWPAWVAANWPAGVPLPQDRGLYSRDDFDQIEKILAEAERAAEAPFTTPPAEDRTTPPPIVDDSPPPAAAPVPVDNGDPIDADAVSSMLAKLGTLDGEARDWALRILGEAKTAGVGISLRAAPTRRMLDLTRAIYAWAQVADDGLCRSGLVHVTGDDAAQPGAPVGAVIGALTVDQAAVFAEVPGRLDAGTLVYVVDERGERLEPA